MKRPFATGLIVPLSIIAITLCLEHTLDDTMLHTLGHYNVQQYLILSTVIIAILLRLFFSQSFIYRNLRHSYYAVASLTVTAVFLLIAGLTSNLVIQSVAFSGLLINILLLLSLVIIGRRVQCSLRYLLFQLNHIGLWLLLAAGIMGATDKSDLKAIITKDSPASVAFTDFGNAIQLPFQLTLKEFSIDRYSDAFDKTKKVPIENGVKQYTALLTISSVENTDQEITQQLLVNHPLKYTGYYIYLESYLDTGEVLLRIVSDPWLWMAYTGIWCIIAGALLMFVSRPHSLSTTKHLKALNP